MVRQYAGSHGDRQARFADYIRSSRFTIDRDHPGDADRTVPYAQALKLKADLERLEVPHELITVPGGDHGNFTPEQRSTIYRRIQEFLTKNGITK